MAGVLTQNLVMQKAKVDDVHRVAKLNVCAAQLQDIGVLRQASGLQVLSLSLNDISEIGALSNCRNLRELYLRNNQIRDINQVLHLTRLPGLEVLNLSDNPIARDPNYRRFVIAAIPSLERLDDINVTDDERSDALHIFPELIYFAPPASRYAEPREGIQAPSQPAAAAGGAAKGGHRGSAAGGAQRRGSGLGNRPRALSANRSNRVGHRASQERRESSRDHLEHSGGRRSDPRAGSSRPTPAATPAAAQRAAAPFRPATPSGTAALGPTDAGVVQAVKILCAELSPQSLDEVRRFIDSLNGY